MKKLLGTLIVFLVLCTNAYSEIYELINDLSFEGKSILLVSSDLEEIIGMSDKIIVIHEGRIKGSLKVDKKLTQENILSIALG